MDEIKVEDFLETEIQAKTKIGYEQSKIKALNKKNVP